MKEMAKPQKKKKFKVEKNETIQDCLARMKDEGYTPIRRFEVPVFKEEGGTPVVSHQEIQFEGRKME